MVKWEKRGFFKIYFQNYLKRLKKKKNDTNEGRRGGREGEEKKKRTIIFDFNFFW